MYKRLLKSSLNTDEVFVSQLLRFRRFDKIRDKLTTELVCITLFYPWSTRTKNTLTGTICSFGGDYGTYAQNKKGSFQGFTEMRSVCPFFSNDFLLNILVRVSVEDVNFRLEGPSYKFTFIRNRAR